jgi:hypothetical protein
MKGKKEKKDALVTNGAFAELHPRLSESKIVQDTREAEDVAALRLFKREVSSMMREVGERKRTILAAVGSLKQIGQAGLPLSSA